MKGGLIKMEENSNDNFQKCGELVDGSANIKVCFFKDYPNEGEKQFCLQGIKKVDFSTFNK